MAMDMVTGGAEWAMVGQILEAEDADTLSEVSMHSLCACIWWVKMIQTEQVDTGREQIFPVFKNLTVCFHLKLYCIY